MRAPVEFEWDTAKAEANLGKHGISFEAAMAVFADPGLCMVDTTRPRDGERRDKAIGLVDGLLITVVFTMRGEACRMISARRSNRSEEKAYDDCQTPT